jgi:hypothetical protein
VKVLFKLYDGLLDGLLLLYMLIGVELRMVFSPVTSVDLLFFNACLDLFIGVSN